MKAVLLVLTLLSVAYCGHIFVEDPILKWQNADQFMGATLRFSLESGTSKDTILRVTWPFAWASSKSGVLNEGTTKKSSGTVSVDSSGKILRYTVGAALTKGVWYELVITQSAATAATAGVYVDPIKMETISDNSANGIVYDSNPSCGQISFSGNVGALKKIQVSTDQFEEKKPSVTAANKDLDATYDIYIDVQPTNDHLEGAFVNYAIDSPYLFSGSCTSEQNICGASAKSTCYNTTKSEGTCTVATDKMSITFEHQAKLFALKWFRIKVGVKQPSTYTTTGGKSIAVFLYSRQKDVYYKYESQSSATTGALFDVAQIVITHDSLVLFWGLHKSQTSTNAWGCPIGLYKKSATTGHNKLDIYNKVTIRFTTKKSLPSAGSPAPTYSLLVGTTTTGTLVPLGSINSDVTLADSAKGLTCTFAQPTITCTNIGFLSAKQYWFSFSVMVPNAEASVPANFGGVQIKQGSADITATTNPTTANAPVLITNDEYLGAYNAANALTYVGSGPQVFTITDKADLDANKATWTIANYATQIELAMKTGVPRQGIKYATAAQDLFFMIDPIIDQVCCKAVTLTNNCGGAVTGCLAVGADATGLYKPQVMIRMFANPNVFNMAPSDTDFKKKGIKPIPHFLNQAEQVTAPCVKASMCGEYQPNLATVPTTYDDAAAQKTAKYYNIWEIEAGKSAEFTSDIAHLAWSCADIAKLTDSAGKACTPSAYDSANSKYPGFIWKNVAFKSDFKANPLYPNKYEVDFLLCFRTVARADATSFGFEIKTTEGALMSTGVIQSMVFNTLAGTSKLQFKALGNTYYQATGTVDTFNNFGVAPVLLRVSAKLAAADIDSNADSVVIFVDQGFVPGTFLDADNYKLCASATGAGSCSVATSAYANLIHFYSAAMQRIVVKQTPVADTMFTNYVMFGFNANLKAMNVGLGKADGFSYQLYKHFDYYGYNGNAAVVVYPQGAQLFDLKVTGDADADVAKSAMNTLGVSRQATTGTPQLTCALATTQIDSTLKMFGGFSADDVSVKAALSVQCGVAMAKNDDTAGWGGAFIVSGIYNKYWSGSTKFIWALSATANARECVEMEYNLKSGNAATYSTLKRYIVVCPSDKSTAVAGDFIAAATTLTLDKFALPWYLPTGAIAEQIGYVWTKADGAVAGYKADASLIKAQGEAANYGSECVIADATGWKKGTGQIMTFAIEVKSPVSLANNGQVLIQQILSAAGDVSNYGTSCLVGGTGLSCSFSSGGAPTLAFTLTASAAGTTVGSLSLNYWVQTSATATPTTGLTYTGKVLAANYAKGSTALTGIINQCIATSKTWTTADSAWETGLENVIIAFDKVKKAQGSFSVKWTVKNKNWDFSTFKVNLDFLDGANSLVKGKNLQCNMYTPGTNDFNFDFTTMDLSSLTAITISQMGTTTHEISTTKFEFRCNGAMAPTTAITASNKVEVTLTTLSITNTVQDSKWDAAATTPARTLGSEVLVDVGYGTTMTFTTSLVKAWGDKGMEASYTIVTKIQGPKPVDAGVWVIVEFTNDIAPKLNKAGILECQMGYNTTLSATFCEFGGDRKVRFLTNQVLKNDTNTEWKFVVYGVAQPSAITYDQIYFAILDMGTGIQWQEWVADVAPADNVGKVIEVLKYSVSGNSTRSSSDFSIDISLASGLVIADQELYVEFPGSFCSAFYKGFTPSCTMNRRNADWASVDSNNYVKNCSYINGRKIRAYLTKDDANANAAAAYRVTIAGVPTPLDPYGGNSFPVVYLTEAKAAKVTYRTASGTMNVTKSGFGNAPGKVMIGWAMESVSAQIGVYSGMATLSPVDKKPFKEDIEYTTTSTASFAFEPSTFKIKGGQKSFWFAFAPKSSTAPGLSFIEFTTTLANYAPLKPLKVKVLATKCNVVNAGNYKFPWGGESLPYVINFKTCIPESSIKLGIYAQFANSSVIANAKNSSFNNPNFTVDGDGPSKVFTVEKSGVPQVSFSLKSTDKTTKKASGIGKLWFVWESSTNQKSYSISYASASVDAVEKPTTSADLTLTVTSPQPAGSASFKFKCSQRAMFYYAVALKNETINQLTYQTIKTNSFAKGFDRTWPDAKNNELIYGYAQQDADVPAEATVTLPMVRSQKKYFVYGICVNTGMNVTDGSKKSGNWEQGDNGGRPIISNITYSESLKSELIDSTCTAFTVATFMACNRTICPSAKNACPGSGNSLVEGATAPPPTTTPPTNTTNTTANATGAGRRRRRVLQNATCNITDCKTCSNATICSECNGTKLLSSDKTACVTTCPTGFEADAAKKQCVKKSTKMSYYYVTLPDAYAKTDTTYADIKAAVADAGFDALFKSKANLGTIKYDPIEVIQVSGTLGNATVQGNITVLGETQADFAATINGTDGFIYFGYVLGSVTKPTFADFKGGKLSNSTAFEKFFFPFVKNGKSIKIELKGLTSATKYTGLWAASNQDPLGMTGSDVSVEEFTTQGTPPPVTTFAYNKSVGFFALLALLFALFILI